MISRLAASDATVLIEGESGSGKEVVARNIHLASARVHKQFVQVNCAALPEHLLESELFGHERGAFTDAHAQKRGLMESAAGGSVMLDEIADLPAGGQAKLLLLLESKTFRRVGGVHEQKADVRILAATNVPLEQRVEQGRFRSDLFFRLNVVRLQVPPLREHPDDIPLLVAHFIARFNHERQTQVRGVSSRVMETFLAYRWPGNIRELKNLIERAFILHGQTDELRVEHFPAELRRGTPAMGSQVPITLPPPTSAPAHCNELEAVERRLIAQALEQSTGNQSKAAKILGITRDTLRYRMKKYGFA
jgi:transcriptional regulator with PAS, ATPase and Fis domain